MNRIIVIQFITLDGVIEDPDGSAGSPDGGWAFRYGPEALATLIRCGALDFTGRNRPALFLEADLLDHAAAAGALFDDIGDLTWIPGNYDGQGEVAVLGAVAPVQSGTAAGLTGEVAVLVRPEGLTIEAVPAGNGIVTHKTFLGSFTRVSVLLSGDVAVKVDKSSTAAVDLVPGASVQVGLVPGAPVLVAEHR